MEDVYRTWREPKGSWVLVLNRAGGGGARSRVIEPVRPRKNVQHGTEFNKRPQVLWECIRPKRNELGISSSPGPSFKIHIRRRYVGYVFMYCGTNFLSGSSSSFLSFWPIWMTSNQCSYVNDWWPETDSTTVSAAEALDVRISGFILMALFAVI